MDKTIEQKYNNISTKIAEIRGLIPIEWFNEQNSYALAEAVACPEYCIYWIKEYVAQITKRNSNLEIENYNQNKHIANLWDRV